MPSMPSTPSAEHRNTSSADDTDKTTTSAGEPSPAAPPHHSSPSTSPGTRHPEHPRKQSLMNLALWCGILAIPLSISIVLVVIIGDVISEDNPLSWVPGALTNLAPVVLVIGVLAFVRAHELLPRVHTLATAATAIASFLLGAAAQASWTVGFEAADAGDPTPTFGNLFLPLCLASWGVGAVAIAIAFDGVVGKRLHPATRTALGAGAGLILAPAGLTITITPFTVTAVSTALVVIAIIYKSRPFPTRAFFSTPPFPPSTHPRSGPAAGGPPFPPPGHSASAPASPPSSITPPIMHSAPFSGPLSGQPMEPAPALPSPPPAAPRTPVSATTSPVSPVSPVSPAPPMPHTLRSAIRSRSMRVLGVCAAVLGLAATSCVVKDIIATGGEGSQLLAIGMQIGFLGILPLLAASGLYFSENSPYSPVHTWGPVVLIVLSVAGAATACREVPFSGQITPGIAASVLCSAAAIAWVIIRRMNLPLAPRIALGIIAGPTIAVVAMPMFPAVAVIPLVGGLMMACQRPRAHLPQETRPATG